MNNLSLYEITSGFPALMENEEITEIAITKEKSKYNRLHKKY